MEREIKIYLVARTTPTEGMEDWLRHLGVAADFQRTLPGFSGEYGTEEGSLFQNIGADVVGVSAKRCYMAFEPGMNPNITKVRKNWVSYFDNILKSGHGSVLEHASYTFAIEGVSRVFTGEMNRHRAGWSVSEGSMRYIRYEDEVPFWMPEIFLDKQEDSMPVRQKKSMTRALFTERFGQMADDQKDLAELWGIGDLPFSEKKKLTSAFRRLIGMGVATGGVWTGNARALRHVIALRSDEHAEEEIAHVFSRIAKIMVEEEPLMFGDFSQDAHGFWNPKYPKV